MQDTAFILLVRATLPNLLKVYQIFSRRARSTTTGYWWCKLVIGYRCWNGNVVLDQSRLPLGIESSRFNWIDTQYYIVRNAEDAMNFQSEIMAADDVWEVDNVTIWVVDGSKTEGSDPERRLKCLKLAESGLEGIGEGQWSDIQILSERPRLEIQLCEVQIRELSWIMCETLSIIGMREYGWRRQLVLLRYPPCRAAVCTKKKLALMGGTYHKCIPSAKFAHTWNMGFQIKSIPPFNILHDISLTFLGHLESPNVIAIRLRLEQWYKLNAGQPVHHTPPAVIDASNEVSVPEWDPQQPQSRLSSLFSIVTLLLTSIEAVVPLKQDAPMAPPVKLQMLITAKSED
ncbi:hypothetical protein BJ742DRAFT_892393 [Cladochytrium replicatum]|nr:hypothetical protein BJ742DRAFT_892393 [Cladochytrium replicatum]